MNNKAAVGIIVLALGVAAGWIWYTRTHQPVSVSPLQEEFTWSFVDRGVDASTSVPKTDIALRVAGVDVPLGTFDGTCTAIAGSSWPFLPNEISGAICYFGGGGKEIGVFEEGGKLVLKQGEVSEGDAEHPGTRSNFVELKKQPTL
ncbi:MAG TPA: hypothetical protein VIY48_19830 [Candidatus Paceibacterota bacterium]